MKKIYYIKINGEVKKITEEEREEFLNSMKKENKKYMCPECKVCDCEKIMYTDIRRCSEVDLALFERKISDVVTVEGKTRHIKDDRFTVFECEKFEPFEEVIINKEKAVAKEVLDITNEILQLKDQMKENYSKDDYERFVQLSDLKNKKIESITNIKVLKRLNKELVDLKGKHKQNIKKTKVLINEQ